MDEDSANSGQTADDAMEETRQDDSSNGVGQAPLPEDNDSPAAPADDNDEEDMKSNQLSDAEVDQHELYDEGWRATVDEANADDEPDEEWGERA